MVYTATQIDMIKRLKAQTGLGSMDSVKILREANFDYSKALDIAATTGMAKSLVTTSPIHTGEKYKDDKYIIILLSDSVDDLFVILDNDKITAQGYNIEKLKIFIHAEDLNNALIRPVNIMSSLYLKVVNKEECGRINEYNELKELIKSYYEVGIIGNTVFMLDAENVENIVGMPTYQYGLPFIEGDSIKYRLFDNAISLDRRLCQMYIDCKYDESKLKKRLNLTNGFHLIDLYSRLFTLTKDLYNDPNNSERTIKL